MSIHDGIDEDHKRLNSKVNLLALAGGKTSPPNPDWLSPLPVGTVILVNFQEGFGSTFLMKFQVSDKSKYAIELWDRDKDTHSWVVPLLFCREFRLFEILHLEQEEKEEDNC